MPFSWQVRARNFCFNMGTLFHSPTNLHVHHLFANYHIKISLIPLNMAVRELKQGYYQSSTFLRQPQMVNLLSHFNINSASSTTWLTAMLSPTYFQHTNALYVSSRFAFDNSHQSSPRHFHHAFPMFFVWQF